MTGFVQVACLQRAALMARGASGTRPPASLSRSRRATVEQCTVLRSIQMVPSVLLVASMPSRAFGTAARAATFSHCKATRTACCPPRLVQMGIMWLLVRILCCQAQACAGGVPAALAMAVKILIFSGFLRPQWRKTICAERMLKGFKTQGDNCVRSHCVCVQRKSAMAGDRRSAEMTALSTCTHAQEGCTSIECAVQGHSTILHVSGIYASEERCIVSQATQGSSHKCSSSPLADTTCSQPAMTAQLRSGVPRLGSRRHASQDMLVSS
jgi:hypothetical protein